MTEQELKPLNKKHQRVLDEYLICFVMVDAYHKVYPNISRESARSSASRLFMDVNFQKHLQERLNEAHMSADEALKLLADMARGDIGDFMDNFGNIDLVEARKAGLTKLIKDLRIQTVTINGKNEEKEIHTQDIKMYDAQASLEKILKIHGKFTDKVDVTSGGEALKPPQIIEIIKSKDE